MRRFSISDAAFNISMTCNLTCDGCESFNNYNFKGQVKFADYADYYKEWSKKLDIEIVTIHGGEPFTNPDILNWVINLKKLWPTADEYYVATNGSILRNKITVARQIIDQGYYINVCVHDPAMYRDIRKQLEEVLEPYNFLVRKIDIGYEYYDEYTDQVYGILEYNYHFKKSAIDYIKDKTWYMHRSDPKQAYKTCLEDLSPCWINYASSLKHITRQFHSVHCVQVALTHTLYFQWLKRKLSSSYHLVARTLLMFLCDLIAFIQLSMRLDF
jgi:hypothetical protein